jgi:phosphoribosylamine--glycine ligase
MKVLIVGSGGREHSIGRKLKSSPHNPELFFAPGNAGTSQLGQNIAIKDSDISALCQFAKDTLIDLTIVGPEAPLVAGIVDTFEGAGLTAIGPNKKAAQIEGSKEWAKSFMKRHNIPTADFEAFTQLADAAQYIKSKNIYPIVIKADGLAAGKGVTVAENEHMALNALNDCFEGNKFGNAGHKVVIEDFLHGEEASIFAFCDGKTMRPMAAAQDHKAIYDGDKGPNTGGMGAYCPAPLITPTIYNRIQTEVFERMQAGFEADDINYKGILYAGLMIAADGTPQIVEFNCRFGDPETQVVLPRLKNDLIDIFIAIQKQTLETITLDWYETHVVDVVLASGGYPGDYEKGKTITGLNSTFSKHTHIIHAGTAEMDNQIITSGGRVLAVVSEGSNLKDAIDTAYQDIQHISFDGITFRKDIGFKALK